MNKRNLCRKTWTKYDTRDVRMCYLDRGHEGNCKGALIGVDGKRFTYQEGGSTEQLVNAARDEAEYERRLPKSKR